MSPFWILLDISMMATTGAIRSEKLQSNGHHQQTKTQFLKGWMPFLSLNQRCQSTEGKALTLGPIPDILTGILRNVG